MPTKEWYEEHKAHSREYEQNYRESHREQIRSQVRTRRQRLRNAVFALLGESCSRCGFEDRRALQIDHINGDGRKERSENNTLKLLTKILAMKNPEEEYQTLCRG